MLFVPVFEYRLYVLFESFLQEFCALDCDYQGIRKSSSVDCRAFLVAKIFIFINLQLRISDNKSLNKDYFSLSPLQKIYKKILFIKQLFNNNYDKIYNEILAIAKYIFEK